MLGLTASGGDGKAVSHVSAPPQPKMLKMLSSQMLKMLSSPPLKPSPSPRPAARLPCCPQIRPAAVTPTPPSAPGAAVRMAQAAFLFLKADFGVLLGSRKENE